MAKISGKVLDRNIYADGGYLEKNPLWHRDESPFKVRQILRMLQKDCLNPKTVCEVGCGGRGAQAVAGEDGQYLPLLGIRHLAAGHRDVREQGQRKTPI